VFETSAANQRTAKLPWRSGLHALGVPALKAPR
jgi:hypothetical protein